MGLLSARQEANEAEAAPPADQEDTPARDCESFSEEATWEGRWRAKHDDHWDLTEFEDPWQDELTADWWNVWVQKNDDSVPNDTIYEAAKTQKWMEAVAQDGQDCRSMLMRPKPDGDLSTTYIPLFKGSNGWEYQIRLHSGNDFPLPGIHCPVVLPDRNSPARLFQLVSRARHDESGSEENQGRKLPKLLLTLGTLELRNNGRDEDRDSWVTETTGYSVMVDVGDQDMPLWLFAARPELEGRLHNPFYNPPVRQLPMFDGLLEQIEEGEEKSEEDEGTKQEKHLKKDEGQLRASEETNGDRTEQKSELAPDKEKEKVGEVGAEMKEVEDAIQTELIEQNGPGEVAMGVDMNNGQAKEGVGKEDPTQQNAEGNQDIQPKNENIHGLPGYDSGCILPSVRRLCTRMSDESSLAAYLEACELLRGTRGVTDPAGLNLPKDLDDEFVVKGTGEDSGLIRFLEASVYDGSPGV